MLFKAPMQKATTLPSTSREWRLSRSASPALSAVVATHERARAMTTVAAAPAIDASDVAPCGHHSMRRSCSTACATSTSDALMHSSASHNDQHLHYSNPKLTHILNATLENDRACVGWLYIETSASKRGFTLRFCVLDGALLSVFRDNHHDAACLGCHVLVSVERLHCINRGLVLTDNGGRRIWVHGDHDTASFEAWIRVLRAGIHYDQCRHDGSIFERPRASPRRPLSRHSGASSSSYEHHRSRNDDSSDLDVSFTGWLRMRRRVLRLNWLFTKATRMYCVLSGRHFAAFSVNVEGKWASVYGQVAAARQHTTGYWLELEFDRGARVRIAGKSPEITASWLKRIRSVLKRAAMLGECEWR